MLNILYARAAAVELQVATGEKICVCTIPLVDRFGLSLVFLYSIVAMILKESAADLAAAKVVLGSLSGLMGIHAVLTGALMLTDRNFSAFYKQRRRAKINSKGLGSYEQFGSVTTSQNPLHPKLSFSL